ncbi:MFS transporter [Bacillus salacetis]|uniref:MFS transporter n=1 Tax=Bacillus salacetis TaxID=2315464 RepID=UPI003BA39760
MGKWDIFKNRNFVMYWLGYLFSALGDAIFILSVSWLIVKLTGSGVVMGTFLLFVGIPRVLFMLVGGIAVDRFSSRIVMFWSDTLRAIVLFIFAAASLTGYVSLPLIFGLGVVFGIVDAFYWPSVTAIRQRIVKPEQYTQSNSVLTGTWQIAAIAGPLLGGILINLLDFTISFTVTAFSFLISAVTLFFIKLLPKAGDWVTEKKSLAADMLEGARFIWGSPLLIAIIMTAVFGNMAMSTILVGLPFLAQEYEVGAQGLSQMQAGLGVGGIAASVLLSAFIVIKKPSPRAKMAILFLQGIMILTIGFTQNHWQVAFLVALIGAAGATLGVLEQSISQTIIPQHMMGRVYSIILIVAQGMTPVAQAVNGWLIDAVGVHQIYFYGGILGMLSGLIGFFLPAVVKYGTAAERTLNA